MKFYFKLPFFLYEGSDEKHCSVYFDNNLVLENIKIDSTDINKTNNFYFETEKEPNFYSLSIVVEENDSPTTVVALDNICISLDNINWIKIKDSVSERLNLERNIRRNNIVVDFNINELNWEDYVNSNGQRILVNDNYNEDFPLIYGFNKNQPAKFWFDTEISFFIELPEKEFWDVRYANTGYKDAKIPNSLTNILIDKNNSLTNISKYYIKLSFYLLEGTEEKQCTVHFDGDLISNNFVINSTDKYNTNDLCFEIEKDFDFYRLDIGINFNENLNSVVALKNIFLSVDNENWVMIIHRHSRRGDLEKILNDRNFVGKLSSDENSRTEYINSNNLPVLITKSPSRKYGFTHDIPAIFWLDTELSFIVELPKKENWDDRYSFGDWEAFVAKIDKISKQTAEELSSKRGGLLDKEVFLERLRNYYNLMQHMYEK